MYRSRLLTIATIAGVLAFGAAAMSNCYGGPTPSTPTTTTTTFAPRGQVVVAPSDAPAGTVVTVQGSFCISDAGHVEVFLATTDAPSTRLAESSTGALSAPPGNWSAELTVPQGIAAGSNYAIEAQCWGDGTPFGQPGRQVEYFAYDPYPFTVDGTP